MDSEMMHPFHEPSPGQAIADYEKWNKKGFATRFTQKERDALERIWHYASESMYSDKDRDALATVREMLKGEPVKHTVDCSKAEKQGGKCTGYGYNDGDDEPIERCKICPQNSMYGLD